MKFVSAKQLVLGLNTVGPWKHAYADSKKFQRWRLTYVMPFLNNPYKRAAWFQQFDGDSLNVVMQWKDEEIFWIKSPKQSLLNKNSPPTRISCGRWSGCDIAGPVTQAVPIVDSAPTPRVMHAQDAMGTDGS